MKEDSVYLNHILDSIKNVLSDTKDFTLDKFLSNRQVKDAVTRNVEIIGEAVKNLPDSCKIQYKETPWRKIAGLRDVLIHEYFDVDLDLVWKIVKKDIPKLKKQVTELLEKF